MSGLGALGEKDQEWLERAACRGMGPEKFYPERRENSAEALAICRTCPVRSECAQYAMDSVERFGIWGGTTPKQRRSERMSEKLRAAGVPDIGLPRAERSCHQPGQPGPDATDSRQAS